MGIMTRLYHRSEGLSDNPYKQFFLDMGENIHIHYRDLRIELSVPEFLEFSEIFNRCAPLVKAKIDEGYRDGVLPNTNELSTLTTIAHSKPLQHPVKYNPNRISIEDNVDGYHIHFRNYKLLFDRKSFENVLQSMNDVIERRGSQRSLDEILHLIAYNDLEYHLIEVQRDTSTKTAMVEVEAKYVGKLRQVFKALGFSYQKETGGGDLFRGEGMEIRARVGKGKVPAAISAMSPCPYVLLVDYLTARKDTITPGYLNYLRLQVLNAFGMVRSGKNPYIDLDYRSFLISPGEKRVVFQATTSPYAGDSARDYAEFGSKFLHSLGLHFVKPEKVPFSDAESREIWDSFQSYIAKEISPHPCVSKIYVLGSSTKNKMGRYEVPFIHFDWAKLASDFDILIEIDEKYPIPAEWDKKFFWKTAGAYYYHLGDVPHKVDSPYPAKYVHVKYYAHLVEAYLFFESNGDMEAKNKFLAGHRAELVYEKAGTNKESSSKSASEEYDWIGGVGTLMADAYGIRSPVVTEMGVTSHNKVYKVASSTGAHVVKVYHKSNFTPAKPGSAALHLVYENAVLDRLEQAGIPAIPVIRDKNNRSIHPVGPLKAMVFPYVDGDSFSNGPGQIETSAAILAAVHQCLGPDKIALKDFDYSTYLAFWLDQVDKVVAESRFAACVPDGHAFVEIAGQIRCWLDEKRQWNDLTWVHGHGDVNPRNYIYRGQSVFIFDFQVARFMPRLADIAEGMIEFGIDEGDLIDARMGMFLGGYESVSPLNEAERKHMNAFLVAGSFVKMLIMLQNDIYFGYKLSAPRMKALMDFCSKLPMP